jgi:hypothetical protein
MISKQRRFQSKGDFKAKGTSKQRGFQSRENLIIGYIRDPARREEGGVAEIGVSKYKKQK